MSILLISGIKQTDLDPDLPLVSEIYGVIDHTSDRVISLIDDSNYNRDGYSTKCARGKILSTVFT